jgi:hypothetical protein
VQQTPSSLSRLSQAIIIWTFTALPDRADRAPLTRTPSSFHANVPNSRPSDAKFSFFTPDNRPLVPSKLGTSDFPDSH